MTQIIPLDTQKTVLMKADKNFSTKSESNERRSKFLFFTKNVLLCSYVAVLTTAAETYCWESEFKILKSLDIPFGQKCWLWGELFTRENFSKTHFSLLWNRDWPKMPKVSLPASSIHERRAVQLVLWPVRPRTRSAPTECADFWRSSSQSAVLVGLRIFGLMKHRNVA